MIQNMIHIEIPKSKTQFLKKWLQKSCENKTLYKIYKNLQN
jgi:hypothetical protein